TRSTASNSITPIRVRCFPPARTRGASQRRNVSVIDPSAIPSSWESLKSNPRTILRPMEPGVAYTKIHPDGEERFQRLRQELGVSTFGMNLIRLRAGERGRIHRHDRQEEVYVVLEGTLTLVSEGEPRELGRGEVARVGPAVRRQ